MGTGVVWMEDLLELKGGRRNAGGMSAVAETLTVGSEGREEKHIRVDWAQDANCLEGPAEKLIE